MTSKGRSPATVSGRRAYVHAADDEARVRELVHHTLAGGQCTGPDGVRTTWRLLDDGPAELRPDEQAVGTRLAGD